MKILLGILGMTAGLAIRLFGQEPRAVSADVQSQVEAVFVKFQDSALELAQPKFEAPGIVC